MIDLFASKLTSTLSRSSIKLCSQYSERYRVVGTNSPYPGPWSFEWFPWLLGMCDSNAEMNVSQKSAQAGNSEVLLNRAFYTLDIKGASVLYVLPNMRPDAYNFSASRFNSALELSPYLSRLFSDVNNVGLKRAGSASLIIAGSRSRSGLKSNPVGFIILDELDEMTQENIPLALARTAGQKEKQVWMVSTPTIDGEGINFYYTPTTQEHFMFRCPSCKRATELTYPECLVIIGDDATDPRLEESYIQCRECKVHLDKNQKNLWLKGGWWEPTYKGRAARGFHINQMYSSTVPPVDIARHAILAMTNASEEQELYNSRLGLTRTVAGTNISDADIQNCIRDHANGEKPSRNGYITIGIDVNKYINYVVYYWRKAKDYTKELQTQTDTHSYSYDISNRYRPKLVEFGKVSDIHLMYPIMEKWKPHAGVIDAQPERRMSYEFAMRYRGVMRMNWYVEGLTGRIFSKRTPDDEELYSEEPYVSVDRTSWLDLTLGRVKHNGIDFPRNLDVEFRQHLKALVRVAKKDKNGNFQFHYKHKKDERDDYAHCMNYAEIALPFAAGVGQTTNIDVDFLG